MSEANEAAIASTALPQEKPKGWLNRTVAGTGVTSALGDFCCEATTVILPGFMAVLVIPAAVLGLMKALPMLSQLSPKWCWALLATSWGTAHCWPF